MDSEVNALPADILGQLFGASRKAHLADQETVKS